MARFPLAHGHRHHGGGVFGCGGVVRGGAPSSGDVSETSSSSPLDAYTTATDRFEKTVSLVQKMMTGTVGTPYRNCSVSFLLFPNLSVSVVLTREQSYIRSGLIDIIEND